MIGQSGVERRYDAFLRGVDGIDAVTVDAFGQPTGAVRHLKAPVPGRNVRLTIDLDTQRAAEQALAYGVRSNASEGANAGALVALDPKNGEVRALASFPTFDPNWFVSFRKPKFQAQLKRISRNGGEPANYPLLDRAIAGRYPAASTFKPFVGDRGRQGAAGHAERDAEVHAVRLLLQQALQQLGQRVQRAHRSDRRARALVRHVLLPPRRHDLPRERQAGAPAAGLGGEVRLRQQDRHRHRRRGPGPAADPAWKTDFYKQNFSDQSKPSYDPNWLFDSSWNAADEINLSIGQGNLNVTPLQLAVGYSAIANGGTVVTPHVVSAIQAPGEPTRIQPNPPRRRSTSGAAAQPPFARIAARDAPAGGHGDERVRAVRVPVAGKTGTAQRVGEPDYALFASYAPVQIPSSSPSS